MWWSALLACPASPESTPNHPADAKADGGGYGNNQQRSDLQRLHHICAHGGDRIKKSTAGGGHRGSPAAPRADMQSNGCGRTWRLVVKEACLTAAPPCRTQTAPEPAPPWAQTPGKGRVAGWAEETMRQPLSASVTCWTPALPPCALGVHNVSWLDDLDRVASWVSLLGRC